MRAYARAPYAALALALTVAVVAAAAAGGVRGAPRELATSAQLGDSSEDNTLKDDYDKSKAIVTGISIPLGIIICLFGAAGRHEKFTLAVVGFAVAGAACFLIAQAAARGSSAEAIVAIIAGAVGGVLGAAAMFFSKAALSSGVTLLGVSAGVVMGLFLETVCLRFVAAADAKLVPMFIFMGLGAIGFGGVSFKYGPGSVAPCVTSSFLGAYAFVRGIGAFCGGFLDPVTLEYSKGIPGLNDHEEVANWVYLGFIAVFWGCGAAYQAHRRRVYLDGQPELDALNTAPAGMFYGAYSSADED